MLKTVSFNWLVINPTFSYCSYLLHLHRGVPDIAVLPSFHRWDLINILNPFKLISDRPIATSIITFFIISITTSIPLFGKFIPVTTMTRVLLELLVILLVEEVGIQIIQFITNSFPHNHE